MNADSNNKSQPKPKRSPNRKSVKALGLLLIWLLLFSLYAPSIGAVPMAQASSAPMPMSAPNSLTAPSAPASAYGSGSASATGDGSNANPNANAASANYSSQLQQAKAKLLATGEGEDDAPPTAPLPLAAAALPMVVNPTFESGTLDGWLTSGQAPTLVTTDPYNGRYTARLDKATSYLYQVVTGLAPNTSYYLKATTRVATAGDYAILGVKNYGGPELSRNIGYTQYEGVGVLFTTGATNTTAEIYIWKPATTDYIYADDFELTESAVANGGFELRSILSPDRNPVGTPVLAPWQASGADAVSIITNEDRRSGVSALRLGPAAGANAVQTVAVKPNTSYVLSIWGKAGSDGQAVEASVKVGDQPEQRQSVTTTTYFDQASFIFTTGTNDTSVSLKVSKVAAGGGGEGYVYADDITVTELVLPPNNALVINGSFENDTLTPWQNWGGGEVVGNNARSGTSALKLGPQIRVGAIQTVRNLSPNTSYTFKGWVKADAGTNATLGVKNYGGEELRQVINTPTYTQASVTFTTGATNTTAEVYVWKTPTAGQGYVYADDLELSLSTPATAPLDAFRLIEAESYTGTPTGGVVREAASKDVYGSDQVGGLANDTVLTYNNVNFGTGANSIELRVLPGSKEATIEVYTDLAATAPLGTARVVPTSSSSSDLTTQPGQTPPPSAPAPAVAPVWNISRALITPTTGVKTVYLKIKGEGASELKLNWFRFFAPTPLDTAELAYVSEMLMLKQGRGITVTFLDAKFVPHLSRILLAFRFDSTSPEGNADLAKIRVGTKINSDINPELNGPQVKVARITARSASSVTVEGDLIKFDDFVQAGSIDIDSAAANAALAQAVNAYGANLDWPDPEPPAPVEQWNEADTNLYLDANKDLQAQAAQAPAPANPNGNANPNPNGQSTTGTGLGASSVNPNSSSNPNANANADANAKPNSSPGTTPPKAKPSGPARIIKLALKLPTFVMDSTGLSLGLSAKGTYYGATANRLSGANERLSDGVALSGEVGVDVASKTSFGWQKMRLFPPTSPLSAITSTVEAKLAFRTNVGLLLTPEEVNITPKDKDIEFSIPTSVGPIPFGLAITLERELLLGSSAFIDCTFSVKYTHATSFSRTPLDPTKLGFQNTSPGCRSPHAPSAVGEFETVIVFKVKAVKSPNLPQPMRVVISAIPEVPPFGKAIKAAKNLVLKGGSLASISGGVGANLKLSYIPWYNKAVPVLSFSVGLIGKLSLTAPEVPPENPLHAYRLFISIENKVPDLYKAEWGLYDLSLKVTNKNPKTGRAEVNWAFTRIADYRETLWVLPPRIVNYSTLPKCELWREAWGRTASIGNQQWKISTQCSGSGSFLYDPAKYRGARYFLRFHRVGMFGQVSTNSVEVPVKNGNSEASLGAPTAAAAAAAAAAGVGGQKPSGSGSGSGEGKATAQSATPAAATTPTAAGVIPVPDPEAEDLDSHYSESEFMTEYKPSEAVNGGYKIYGGFSSYGEENPPTQPLLRSIKCSVTEAPKSGMFTLDPPGPQSNPALHELQFGSGIYKPNSPSFTGTDEFVVTCKWRNAGGAIVTNVHRQSLFIESAGNELWAWGNGSYGALGDGTNSNRSTPLKVQNLSGIKQVVGDFRTKYALLENGEVWAWGDNQQGQLGDGTTTNRFTPGKVPNLSSVKQLTIGYGSIYALLENGEVWAWGLNTDGQVGDGTTTNRSTPVRVLNLTDVEQVISPNYSRHGAYALLKNGEVWAWGHNDAGQLGDGTTTNRSTPVRVQNLNNVEQLVVSVSDNRASAYAILGNGELWVWGANRVGQLGDGTTTNRLAPVKVQNLTGVKQVIPAQNLYVPNVYALLENGEVWAWGYNTNGQLGDGTTTNRLAPVKVQNLTGVKHVVASSGGHDGYNNYTYAHALLGNGEIWTWGNNQFGQLGDGTTTHRSTPVRVPNLTNVKQVIGNGITSYFAHTYALLENGEVWAWGSNNTGQLGDGTTTNRLAPVKVLNLTGVKQISSINYHQASGFALLENGEVWAWGNNYWGQLGDGTTTTRPTPAKVSSLDKVTELTLVSWTVYTLK